MADMESNPLAIMTFIAAPAIITNACSMLVLNTTNRLARVVDRVRIIHREIEASGRPEWKVRLHDEEIGINRRRARLLVRGMATIYGSIGSFAAAALLSLIGAALQGSIGGSVFSSMLMVSLAFGALGLMSLIVGCFCLFAEVRLAMRAITIEGEYVRDMDAARSG